MHNGAAKKGASAPNYRHGRRARYEIFMGEPTLGHRWLKSVTSEVCQWIVRNSIYTAFDNLGIGDLIAFVISEAGHEVSRLEQLVESGVEVTTLPPPQRRRPSVGRAAEQIEQIRARVEQCWAEGGPRRSRSKPKSRKSMKKSIEQEAEAMPTHIPVELDREAIERMGAAITGAIADLEASNNQRLKRRRERV
jgi:hypothetical protein